MNFRKRRTALLLAVLLLFSAVGYAEETREALQRPSLSAPEYQMGLQTIGCSVYLSGGVPPYTVDWHTERDGGFITGNSVILNAEGGISISCFPTDAGVYSFHVTVRDAQGAQTGAQTKTYVAVYVEETPKDWEKSLEGVELTGDWAQDLLAVARSQLGYRESERNFILNEDGRVAGYTRYGEWYGASYGEWCAMFASFCLHYANVPEEAVPQEASCTKWIALFMEMDAFRKRRTGYVPQPGDLIFFGNHVGDARHMGIVESVGERIITIEGNVDSTVVSKRYFADDESIIGYAVIGALQ